MKSIATLLMCALVLVANAVAAQPVKIGFIDAPRIERESKELQLSSEKLKREFAPRALELEAMKSKVDTLRAQLDKPEPGASVAQLEKKQREFTLSVQRLEQARRALTEDLQLRKNEELKKFYARVNATVEKIAKAKNLDLVLQGVTYVSKDLDITGEVIKALNASAGTK
jgi:outer membrane protein